VLLGALLEKCNDTIRQQRGIKVGYQQNSQETELDKFFAYGYGAHHFWLKHRRLSNGETKEYRLLKVEF